MSFAENYSIVSNFCIVKVDTGCNVLDGKKTQQNKELDHEIGAKVYFLIMLIFVLWSVLD